MKKKFLITCVCIDIEKKHSGENIPKKFQINNY